MTSRRDISLTLALCLSLTAHAYIVYAVAERYAAQFWRVSLAPLAMAIAAPAEGPPPRPPLIKDPMDRLGADDRAGGAIADLIDETPQQARQADQEQAALSVDPEGSDGRPAAEQPAAPPREAAPRPSADAIAKQSPPTEPMPAFKASAASELSVPGAGSIALAPTVAPRPRRQEIAVAETAGPLLKQREAIDESSETDAKSEAMARPANQAGPTETATLPQPPEQQLAPAATSDVASAANASAESGAPGDPAPQADSESDPFSTAAGAEFRRGATVSRLGRKHRITTPRLEMAGYADLMQIRPPVVIVLRIYLRIDGTVEKVDVIKSSGSINVDQPTKQAAYRWWFEPRKNAAGVATTEVFDFPCKWL